MPVLAMTAARAHQTPSIELQDGNYFSHLHLAEYGAESPRPLRIDTYLLNSHTSTESTIDSRIDVISGT